MSDSFKCFQRDFESFAKKQAEEIAAVRAALQLFLAHITSALKKGEAERGTNLASRIDGSLRTDAKSGDPRAGC